MSREQNRREFTAAAAGALASGAGATARPGFPAPVDPKELAINGGKPVRSTRLTAGYWGADYYDAAEEREVLEVVKSKTPFRWYGAAKPTKVLNFERDYARHQGTKYAVAVTSGTSALISAISALEVGPGDEVILPAWTWYSCYNAIVLAGGLPVFAEVDETLNLDPKDLDRKITPKTKVIMAVHILGGPADMDPILEIARSRKIRILEDFAQSVGGRYKGKQLGSIGDIGICSFQVNKTISAGEGGAVVTSDPVLFERAARFHDLGGLRPAHEELIGKPQLAWFVGGQYRMSEFTGAVMGAQLKKLDAMLESSRGTFRRVRAGISDLPGLRQRRLPDPDGDIGSGMFIALKDAKQRDQFIAAMNKENVSTGKLSGSVILPTVEHIEKKITLHPNWPSFNTPRGKSIPYGRAACPQTLDVFDRFAAVHLHPRYSEKDVDDVIAAITKVHMALFAPRA